jgi:hypothetical protein
VISLYEDERKKSVTVETQALGNDPGLMKPVWCDSERFPGVVRGYKERLPRHTLIRRSLPLDRSPTNRVLDDGEGAYWKKCRVTPGSTPLSRL